MWFMTGSLACGFRDCKKPHPQPLSKERGVNSVQIVVLINCAAYEKNVLLSGNDRVVLCQ